MAEKLEYNTERQGEVNNKMDDYFKKISALRLSVSTFSTDVTKYYSDISQLAGTLRIPMPPFVEKLPDFVQKIRSYNQQIGDISQKLMMTKNTLSPFIGLKRTKKFPKPEDTEVESQTKDGTTANRTVFNNILNQNKELDERGKAVQKIYKSWVKITGGKEEPINHSTGDKTASVRMAPVTNALRQLPGSYKFFIEKLHGYSDDGTPYEKNPVNNQDATARDYPNRMLFPAYIQTFNDSYSTSFSDYSFLGRPDKVYAYQNTERTMQLTFTILADYSAEIITAAMETLTNTPSQAPQPSASKDGKLRASVVSNPPGATKAENLLSSAEIQQKKLQEFIANAPNWGTGAINVAEILETGKYGTVAGEFSGTPEQLWNRATFLAQCVYPYYRQDGKLKEQPFIRLRIGDFYDLVAKIDSMQFTQDDFDMDLNESESIGNIPLAITVSMSLTIVHDETPRSNYIRFYHRKDFDINTKEYRPESTKKSSIYKDEALDIFAQKYKKTKNNVDTMPEEAEQYLEAVDKFSAVLEQFDKVANLLPGDVQNLVKLNEISKVLSHAQKLNNLAQKLKSLERDNTDSEETQEINQSQDLAPPITQVFTTDPVYPKLV